MYLVYMIVNKCNTDDLYIGMTSRGYGRLVSYFEAERGVRRKRRVDRRIRDTGGWKNWKWIPIVYAETKQECLMYERYHITRLYPNLNCAIPHKRNEIYLDI